MSAPRKVRIAAVQPALRLGEVEANLRRIEDLARDAHREHAPEVILVPEACSSPNVYSKLCRQAARPVDGAPMQLLRGLARELDCVVAGGFLARRGNDVYGTFVVAEPDGRTHLHDKDIPTAWEQNYYRGGDDEGRMHCHTLDAPIATTSGWELIRSRTARRLVGRTQLLLAGMCWPSYPHNWRGPLNLWARREHARQLHYARELPRQMARHLGAPVAHASHVGDIAFDTPLGPGIPWRTTMIGETQIVERDGSILARLTYEDGEGHIAAEVGLAPPEPLDPIIDEDYWLPPMTASMRVAFHAMNLHGAVKYRGMKALKLHPWQQWPGGDLPDELPPSEPAGQTMATTA